MDHPADPANPIRRKIIAKFPTLLEAEAAVTALEASGIYAIVNNEIVGGMMPHASDALGGFQVSVDADKEAEARALLEGAVMEEQQPAAEPVSLARQVDQMMKRATYGAVMGCIILPVVANLFSVSLYVKAFRRSPVEFWRHPWLVALGAVFNLAAIGLAAVLIFAFYGEFNGRQDTGSYDHSEPSPRAPEAAPVAATIPAYSREDREACFAREANDQARIIACNNVIAKETDRRVQAAAFVYMGIAYDRQGKHDSAIREFGHALDLDPESADAYLQRAYTRAVLGDYPSALVDYDRAVLLEPKASMARGHRCFLHFHQKRLRKAIRDCDEAVALAEGDGERARELRASALEVRGMVRLEMGQAKEAISDFDAALALRPGQEEALYGRGLAKRAAGDPKGAEADIAAATKLEPGVAKSYAKYPEP